MGGLRGIATTDITLSASPPLPPRIHSNDIILQVPKRFSRSGSGLAAAYLPYPTFSRPRILEHGALLAFTLCLNASHIDAGSYVGQVIVDGPRGIQPATVAIALNAKDNGLFNVGIALAGLTAFVLLTFRALKVKYDALAGNDKTVKNAIKGVRKDPLGFWAPTVIAVAGAIVAMLQIYDANPAWGADKVSSFIALASTAITAAGVGTFLSSLKGS